MTTNHGQSKATIYWTAFIGLFFDYYDLYLFAYLERTLAKEFSLSPGQSSWLQFAGFAGVGVGALVFGYLADRFGRGRLMLAVFALYAVGIAGLSQSWNYESLLGFRLFASMSLGAEWGISHIYLAERVGRPERYRFSALLQFAILGGLLAALMSRYALPVVGWRWLFAASIGPVAILSVVRRRDLGEVAKQEEKTRAPAATSLRLALVRNAQPFLLCFGVASLTIASGTMNVFYVKDLPQAPLYTVLFWGNVAPGMLLGAWVVRKGGVNRALAVYAIGLLTLSLACWFSASSQRTLVFALGVPLLNGIPFGLMGAWFSEVFGEFRTMLSGAAYNLGRILAGFAPVLITALGLHERGNYFLFSGALGLGVLGLSWAIKKRLPAVGSLDPRR